MYEDQVNYDAIGKKIRAGYPDAYPGVPDDMLGQRYASKYGVPTWAKPKPQPIITGSSVTGSVSNGTPAPQGKSGYTREQYVADLKRDAELTGGKNAAFLKQYYDAANGGTGGAGDYLKKTVVQPVGKPVAPATKVVQKVQAPTVTGAPRPTAPSVPQKQNKSLWQQAGEFITGGASQVASTIGGALDSALPDNLSQTHKTQESVKNAHKMSTELVRKAQQTKDPNEKKRLLDLSRQVDRSVGEASRQFVDYTKQAIGTPTSPLQSGIKTATGVGALLVPGGKTVKEVLAAGAATGGMYAASKGNTPIESARNVPGGAITGAATAGVLKGASAATKGAVNLVKGVPNKAAQGVTKATPAAWTKAMQEHGVDVNKLVQEMIPAGSKYEDMVGTAAQRGKGGILGQKMQTAEKVIQATAKAAGNNVRISGDEIIKALRAEAKPISKELGSGARANAIKEIIKQAEKKYAKGATVKTALDTLRSANEKFGKNIVEVDAGDAVANAAQKLEANTLRTTLKKMFPQLADALDTQSKVFTLRPILNKAIGTANTQGSTIRSGSLKNFDLSKPATWFTAIPEALMSNPKIATNVMHAGDRFAGMLPPIVRQAGGVAGDIAQKAAGLVGGAVGATMTPGGQTSYNPQNNSYDATSTSQYDQGSNVNGQQQVNDNTSISQDTNSKGSLYGYTYEELAQSQLQAQNDGNTDAVDQIQKMMDNEAVYQKTNNTADKPHSAQQIKDINLANNGLRGLDVIKQELNYNNQTGVDPSTISRITAMRLFPFHLANRKLYKALFDAAGARLRIESGAALSPDEIKRYVDQYIAQLGDDPNALNYEISQLDDFLNGIKNQGAASDVTTGQLPPIQ